MEKYIEIFNKLWEHSENEVVEFKKAETNFDIDELGKYFSALSNEANLRDHEFAWIVFGVWDKKHQIIGTTFKDGEVALNRLKQGNKTMRELPGGTLFPDTMKQYDEYTIREALHNAIAHQDYTLLQRIVFVEGPSTLYYGNGGSFIPGTIENALEHKGPQFHYRNDCLCRGMVNFNMIDTVGRGIKKIYTEQRNRFFPMPDYEIDNEHRTVGVTIYGKMIDEKYTNLLKANNSLSLKECLWLDAVQKHHPITKEAAKHLHEKGLIEGRAPHYTISLKVAKMTKQIGHYTKENGLAENSIQKLLLQLAHNAGSMGFKRQDVYEGLQHVFPSSLTQDEKLRKIGNLLRKIAKEGFIIKTISGKQWIITEKGEQELNY